ncbi:ExeM/NucH family extracellular endonuclease, partial [Nocardioides sp.]|uniref:ExeM/NucH family extracellular endonuclease n=1 Tax=Nocardioides sp. TaxID=35761 RepID=UPI002ED4E4EF
GVVTAAYPTGDFFSFVIQTEGTGTATDATPGSSDALWVFHRCCGMDAEVGQYVEVTGLVEERFGRTQLVYDPDEPLTVLDEPFDPVTPLATEWWTTETEREAHESELLDVSGVPFTVSNNFNTNRFGEVGLAAGDRPLVSPTEVANPNLDPAGYQAALADNFARGVVLDDGADWDYLNDEFSWDDAVPWIDRETTARVGAPATVTGPVILDFGFGDWRFQPTSQVIGTQPSLVSFGETRPENAAPASVGGDLRIATFNVLNYFNTTGEDFEAAGGSCTYFTDRFGEEVTNEECVPDGPRGAADDEDLDRQQRKIVTAINALDASVVSLEEIENSVKLGEDRDDALQALTEALNAAAGTERWAFVPSPAPENLPALEDQDVIRTAFIYDPSTVELVGGSEVLVGSPAFGNARQPLAQAFRPVGASDADAFAVIVNHFKSKGSPCAGEPNGPQGNCNQSRIAQARALDGFADEFAAERDLEQVFLTGDFNAYSQEDPMVVLDTLGWTNLESDTEDEWSYSFDGMSGSLDHVLANDAALAEVTGVDIWEINANEALAFEYSRFNYNVTDFYEDNLFRASDHNPELVGIDVRDASEVSLALSPSQVKRKRGISTATVTVTGVDDQATGIVRFLVDGEPIGQRALLEGSASIAVGPFDTKGNYTVTVEYLGDDDNLPGTDSATLRVGN